MENLKIRVTTEQESKEAQELFFELGYKFSMVGFCEDYNSVQVFDDGSGSLFEDHDTCENKELTIQQLKDMVVLKRNDVGDATHENCMFPYIKLSDGWYYFDNDVKKWLKSTGGKPEYFEKLKPIEKEMKTKEYLKKNTDGVYELVDGTYYIGQHSWIEVPEGAEDYRSNGRFYKENGRKFFKVSGVWADSLGVSYKNLWKRDQEPMTETEYLMQGENGKRLMESVEQLNVSQWDVQVGGDHYKSMKIQPAQFALENKLDYCQANAIKYICRHESKNGKQDLEKAKHYIDLLIEHYYGNS